MKKLIFILICMLAVVPGETKTENNSTITKPTSNMGAIMTVLGLIRPSEFGKVLVHEHVMVDFIGAAKTGRHRYNQDDVVETMLPYLHAVRQRGFTGFVDCTPAWLGRDVEVLRRLAEQTDLHILTNTGYYGTGNDKFLPAHAFSETDGQLAARWVREWEHGIDGTNIKPGFIKTSVDKGPLSKIDRKLVRAAAKAHLQTGLTIACHTGEAKAALGVLETVRAEGVDASALIIVHADGINKENVHVKLAEAGAWIEYDGVSDKSIRKHVRLIKKMLEAGFGDQLLISHDAGWYRVGEGEAAKKKIRPYNAISDQLIPALKAADVSDAGLHKLFVENPAKAFTIRVRKK
ncbi:MAG: phosphotriesterase family protein [Planctomycetota bacterium]